jgi:hypothetical protein
MARVSNRASPLRLGGFAIAAGLMYSAAAYRDGRDAGQFFSFWPVPLAGRKGWRGS